MMEQSDEEESEEEMDEQEEEEEDEEVVYEIEMSDDDEEEEMEMEDYSEEMMGEDESYDYKKSMKAETKEMAIEHTFGVQINGLINQVLNFSNTTQTTSTNPYLFTYNINSIKSGWGLRCGLGYVYNASGTNDGVTTRTTNINDIHARLGIEKKFKLSEKWSSGVGLDFVYNNNSDNSSAKTVSFDTVTTKTKTTVSNIGGGAMAWLRYNITKNIQIGTETSLNYTTGTQKIWVQNTSNFGGVITQPDPTETNDKQSNASINLPIVFYLSVRF
jgi:hypothetical protein